MTDNIGLFIATVAFAAFASGAAPAALKDHLWHRRIVLVSTPDPIDPLAVRQRGIFADWSRGAADRDVSLVEVSGSRVDGASDAASVLSRRYHLPPGAFQVLLIGKDGNVALRSAQPIDAATLQNTIDAMPMRRAGER